MAKKKRRPRLQWPKEQMARAMAAVGNKEMFTWVGIANFNLRELPPLYFLLIKATKIVFDFAHFTPFPG